MGSPHGTTARQALDGVPIPGFFRRILEELKPMSDRTGGTMRIIVACLLVWLVMLTFRNPMADMGVFMVFIFMQRSTLMTRYLSVLVIIAMIICSLCIVGIACVSWNISWLRILLWGGTFWICYYLMSRLTQMGIIFMLPISFGAVFCFGFDQGYDPNWLISQFGWLWCAVGMAMIFTMFCQYLFGAPTAHDLLTNEVRTTLRHAEAHCIARAEGKLSRQSLGVNIGVSMDQAKMLRKFGGLSSLQLANCRRILNAVGAIDRLAFDEGLSIAPDGTARADWLSAAAHLHELRNRLFKPVVRREGEPNPSEADAFADPILAEAMRELLAAEKCLDPRTLSTEVIKVSEEPKAPVRKDFSDEEFATRATLATMACYMFASMTDWSGIHTCMITCAVTAMNNVDSQIFKQRLRFIGASIGGLMGFLAMFLIPHMDNLMGVLIIAVIGIGASAWISMGREKYSYIGIQMALAFVMLVMQDPHATTSFTIMRDRLVGILVGLVAMRYAFVWWTPKYIRGVESSPAWRLSPI